MSAHQTESAAGWWPATGHSVIWEMFADTVCTVDGGKRVASHIVHVISRNFVGAESDCARMMNARVPVVFVCA